MKKMMLLILTGLNILLSDCSVLKDTSVDLKVYGAVFYKGTRYDAGLPVLQNNETGPMQVNNTNTRDDLPFYLTFTNDPGPGIVVRDSEGRITSHAEILYNEITGMWQSSYFYLNKGVNVLDVGAVKLGDSVREPSASIMAYKNKGVNADVRILTHGAWQETYYGHSRSPFSTKYNYWIDIVSTQPELIKDKGIYIKIAGGPGHIPTGPFYAVKENNLNSGTAKWGVDILNGLAYTLYNLPSCNFTKEYNRYITIEVHVLLKSGAHLVHNLSVNVFHLVEYNTEVDLVSSIKKPGYQYHHAGITSTRRNFIEHDVTTGHLKSYIFSQTTFQYYDGYWKVRPGKVKVEYLHKFDKEAYLSPIIRALTPVENGALIYNGHRVINGEIVMNGEVSRPTCISLKMSYQQDSFGFTGVGLDSTTVNTNTIQVKDITENRRVNGYFRTYNNDILFYPFGGEIKYGNTYQVLTTSGLMDKGGQSALSWVYHFDTKTEIQVENVTHTTGEKYANLIDHVYITLKHIHGDDFSVDESTLDNPSVIMRDKETGEEVDGTVSLSNDNIIVFTPNVKKLSYNRFYSVRLNPKRNLYTKDTTVQGMRYPGIPVTPHEVTITTPIVRHKINFKAYGGEGKVAKFYIQFAVGWYVSTFSGTILAPIPGLSVTGELKHETTGKIYSLDGTSDRYELYNLPSGSYEVKMLARIPGGKAVSSITHKIDIEYPEGTEIQVSGPMSKPPLTWEKLNFDGNTYTARVSSANPHSYTVGYIIADSKELIQHGSWWWFTSNKEDVYFDVESNDDEKHIAVCYKRLLKDTYGNETIQYSDYSYLLLKKSDFGSAPVTDTTPPDKPNITSHLNAEKVGGKIFLRATANDAESGISSVSYFYKNGLSWKSIGGSATAPYIVEWDTSTLNGNYHIKATAYNNADPMLGTDSDLIELTVDNSAPTEHIEFTTVAEGTIIDEPLELMVHIPTTFTPVKVNFFANNVPIGVGNNANNFTTTFDPESFTGSVILRADLYDSHDAGADVVDTVQTTVTVQDSTHEMINPHATLVFNDYESANRGFEITPEEPMYFQIIISDQLGSEIWSRAGEADLKATFYKAQDFQLYKDQLTHIDASSSYVSYNVPKNGFFIDQDFLEPGHYVLKVEVESGSGGTFDILWTDKQQNEYWAYPIGNRIAGNKVDEVFDTDWGGQTIQTGPRNTMYPDFTQDDPWRWGGTSAGWYNFQDTGSYSEVPALKGGGLHPGEDWNYAGGDKGKLVYMPANGIVIGLHDYDNLGWLVATRHTNDNQYYYSIFLHITSTNSVNGAKCGSADDFKFQVGDKIMRNEKLLKIADIDALDPDNANHLHFEIRDGNEFTVNGTALHLSGISPNGNKNGYYSTNWNNPIYHHMDAVDVEEAMDRMQLDGIIDPSDFIDDNIEPSQ